MFFSVSTHCRCADAVSPEVDGFSTPSCMDFRLLIAHGCYRSCLVTSQLVRHLASSSPALLRTLLHGQNSSLSNPTNHPFTGSLRTPTPLQRKTRADIPRHAWHACRVVAWDVIYSIGSTSCLRTSFLASPAKNSRIRAPAESHHGRCTAPWEIR
jgi:hypothetical protein